MDKMNKYSASLVAVIIFASVSGCSSMSAREKSTAIGAGVGAAAGAVVTGGSTLGTLGGAAVGGVIGNQIGKDK